MYQKRDLVLEQIEQIGKLLGVVLQSILGRNVPGSHFEKIQQTKAKLSELLDPDPTELMSSQLLKTEAMTQWLNKHVHLNNAESFADVCLELGDLYGIENKDKAIYYYTNAKTIYEILVDRGETISWKLPEKLNYVKHKIKQ